MPPAGLPSVSHSELLSFEQLAEMVHWLSQHMPIERVKLTGGEPLVRRGLEDLVEQLSTLPSIREVSLTTNGSLLSRKAQALKSCGLARISLSLDSLDPQRFSCLSRGGRLQDTLEGIEEALKVGLTPLKLNTVLQRSTWKEEVPLLLDFAAERGLEPRFIELMRTGTERAWCASEFVAVGEVKTWLQKYSPVVSVPTPPGAPAQLSQVRWKGILLKVGWIAPRSHPFCGACERVRMDSRGRLRRCLMDPTLLDLVQLRKKCDLHARTALYDYISEKRAPSGMDSESMMSQIGG